MIKSARIKFDKLLGETPRAYLIRIGSGQHWIPKSMCRDFITNKKLGGNVVLPTFIINRIFDVDINDTDSFPCDLTPTWIVEHHTPERHEPIPDNTISDLRR